MTCSFCGKPRENVEFLFTGPTPEICICNNCVTKFRIFADGQRALRREQEAKANAQNPS